MRRSAASFGRTVFILQHSYEEKPYAQDIHAAAAMPRESVAAPLLLQPTKRSSTIFIMGGQINRDSPYIKLL